MMLNLKCVLLASVAIFGAHSAAAEATVDQSAVYAGAGRTGSSAPYTTAYAQTYTAGLTGSLVAVEIGIDALGPVTLEIRNVEDGTPGADVLASAVIPVSLVGHHRVEFDAPAPQVAGQQYAIVVMLAEAGTYVRLSFYERGQMLMKYPGAAWTAMSWTYDIVFSTFVAPDTAPPTVTMSAPIQGGRYRVRESVPASYTCSDPSGVSLCSGTVALGTLIDTSRPGEKTFFVTSTDAAGNTGSTLVNYTVEGAQLERPPAAPPKRGK